MSSQAATTMSSPRSAHRARQQHWLAQARQLTYQPFKVKDSSDLNAIKGTLTRAPGVERGRAPWLLGGC
jgi:hypothetical protein